MTTFAVTAKKYAEYNDVSALTARRHLGDLCTRYPGAAGREKTTEWVQGILTPRWWWTYYFNLEELKRLQHFKLNRSDFKAVWNLIEMQEEGVCREVPETR